VAKEVVIRICPNCRLERPMNVVGRHSFSSNRDPNFSFSNTTTLLQCEGCERHSIFTMHSNEYEDEYLTDEYGEIEHFYPEREIFTAPAVTRENPEWFSRLKSEETQTVYENLLAVYVAFDSQIYKLAAMGIRSLFEDLAHSDGAPDSLNFKEKLDKLEELKRISTAEREDLDVLVASGNAATHRKWNPPRDDIDILLTILEGYIYSIYLKEEDESMRNARERERKLRIRGLAARLPADNRRKSARNKIP